MVVSTITTQSTLPNPQVVTNQVVFPHTVTQALCQIHAQVNGVMHNLVRQQSQAKTDYRHCRFGKKNKFGNWITQIDMQGLTDEGLRRLGELSISEVASELRQRIFEVEDSWAMYGILRSVFARGAEPSFYGRKTQELLDFIRVKYQKPIALLAVTKQKYHAMKAEEFGKDPHEPLSDQEIQAISGFDTLWGPEQFLAHVKENAGQCQYLLYIRPSDPVDKLRNPGLAVEHPLLLDPDLRATIRANALTLNIDDPGDVNAIKLNDTKAYLQPLNMGVQVDSMDDLARFRQMAAYCLPGVTMRAKPLQGAYGCYGHVRGSVDSSKFFGKVRKEMKKRGAYLLQKELPAPKAVINGASYAYIDRVFVGMINDEPTWMGGHRELLPLDSQEAQSGRLHGNVSAIFKEII